MDRHNLVQLAVDGFHGTPNGNYSVGETQEALRNALVELNGGSTKLNFRKLRENPQIFSIVEEIITKTTLGGLSDSCPLFDYVEYHNTALGDTNSFEVTSSNSFVVSEVAEGTQGIRRQRMIGNAPIVVQTTLKAVKIYEELNRVLAGRIDFNDMINNVSKAFQKKLNADMYSATSAAFKSLATPYKVTGTFDADKLATLIDHVEAETGETAVIMTSKQGARKITGIVGADATSAKEDLYNMGYFGHFGVNPIIVMQNAHVAGTTDFILGNDLYVVGANDKFIKVVTEGDTLILNGDPYANADLSQEYMMAQRWGVAVAMAEQAGIYEL